MLNKLFGARILIEDDIHDVLLGLPKEGKNGLLGETYGCGILDSGCSKNVTGTDWFKAYIETLDKQQLKEVKYEQSESRFRFGNPTIYKSIYKVTFPATIGSKKILISADVIGVEIPLLISKAAMKKANTVINFKHDTVRMFGESIKVRFTSTGHYCVCLNKYIDVCYYGIEGFNVYFTNLQKIDDLDTKDKERAAVKLHKQFCHASGKRLKELLTNAKVKDKEILKMVEQVSSNCDICKRYKKAPPKPIVTMPLAKVFNENVAMDLKDFGSKKVIHLIDHVTRFSAACVIPSKRREVVVDAVLKIWVSIFGSPKKILSDNGGEFNNEDFNEMGEKLNTKITSTAAESPWSNGINERHNGILAEMVYKTMEDTKCSLETALMWSVTAKNTLSNVYGFSPCQLVLGRNASFPSIVHDKLPALDKEYSTEYMRKNLDVLHRARENYVKAESSEKLQRAMRMKTRTHTGKVFEVGQSVYFKRKDSNRWKGPGDVIGVQGETVAVLLSVAVISFVFILVEYSWKTQSSYLLRLLLGKIMIVIIRSMKENLLTRLLKFQVLTQNQNKQEK